MKTTNEILTGAIRANVITEREILTLKRRANAGDQDARAAWPCVPVTPEQAQKGFNWLYNQYKTPRGVERKNNPFGYREQNIINNYGPKSSFIFCGFYNIGSWCANFVQVYELDGMQYYVNGGQIVVIG